MNRTIKVFMLLLAWACTALAEEARIGLSFADDHADVFGGTNAQFHISLASPKALQGWLAWCFSAAGRTITRGESAVSLSAGVPETVTIDLQVPPVKKGVVMTSALDATLHSTGAREALANIHKPIWVFPEDPFAYEKEWLKDLQIRLFDPEGNTVAAFESLQIPFEEIGRSSAIGSISEGILIIGEGISLMDYRGLDELMVEASARGIPVLCLALSEGEFYMPGTRNSKMPEPEGIQFARSGRIKAFDKRLDNHVWSQDRATVASRIAVLGERGAVIGDIETGDKNGWPWIEFSFKKGDEKLLICGFGIIQSWKDSPAPRYLFREMLKYLKGRNENGRK